MKLSEDSRNKYNRDSATQNKTFETAVSLTKEANESYKIWYKKKPAFLD